MVKNEKILVVDDEEDILEVLKYNLEKEGYQVKTASDGNAGLEIARKLQVMGYVGHFDVDCIVSDDNKLYLLEVNARRTGGTHVHEFAKHMFGDDYINQVSLISFEAASSGVITDPDRLIQVLDDYLYPMAGDGPLGVVVTITNALFKNRFGYVIVAPTEKQAIALQESLNERIRNYSG